MQAPPDCVRKPAADLLPFIMQDFGLRAALRRIYSDCMCLRKGIGSGVLREFEMMLPPDDEGDGV
jgi:hypothetical protein